MSFVVNHGGSYLFPDLDAAIEERKQQLEEMFGIECNCCRKGASETRSRPLYTGAAAPLGNSRSAVANFRSGNREMIPPSFDSIVEERRQELARNSHNKNVTANRDRTVIWPGGVGSMVPPSLDFSEIARQRRQ